MVRKRGRPNLAEEDIRQRVALYEQGLTYRQIANQIGVSFQAVAFSLRGRVAARHSHPTKPIPMSTQECLGLYAEGKSAAEIGRLAGVSYQVILRRLRPLTPIRPAGNRRRVPGQPWNAPLRKLTEQQLQEAAALYNQGRTMPSIAPLFGVTAAPLYNALRKFGLAEIRPRGSNAARPRGPGTCGGISDWHCHSAIQQALKYDRIQKPSPCEQCGRE